MSGYSNDVWARSMVRETQAATEKRERADAEIKRLQARAVALSKAPHSPALVRELERIAHNVEQLRKG